jgi:hypothetical protein
MAHDRVSHQSIDRLRRMIGVSETGCQCSSAHEVLAFRQGEPVPSTLCPRCGREIDAVVVEEVVISTREEYEKWRA